MDFTKELTGQIRSAYEACHNVQEVARQFGVGHSTVRRYAHDLITAHTNKIHEMVIRWRREVRETGKRDMDRYMAESGLEADTIAKIICGKNYRHLNEIAPPVRLMYRKDEERERARELYSKENKTFNEIVDILQVSKSSVSLWCRDLIEKKRKSPIAAQEVNSKREKARALYAANTKIPDIAKQIGAGKSIIQRWCEDLIEERRQKGLVKPKPHQKKAKEAPTVAANSRKMLTDDQVIELREAIRRDGTRSLTAHAKKYNSNATSISNAVRGKTFKHLNDKYPPVVKKLPVYDKNGKVRRDTNEELVEQVITMRRDDPGTWDYKKLARWLSEQDSRKYSSTTVKKLIINRAPELLALEEQFPVVRSKPKKRVLTPEQKRLKAIDAAAKRLKKRQAEKQALEKLIAEEDAREEALRIRAHVDNRSVAELAVEYV